MSSIPPLATERPHRSVLYVPGANSRAMNKTPQLDADVVILDLEDAVAPNAKVQARDSIAQFLATPVAHQRRIVRVNGLDTPWGEQDLQTLATAGADAFLIPKVAQPETLLAAQQFLAQAGAPADMPLWAMIETPAAFLQLPAIASATPLLQCLVAGTSDLVKDLRARHTPQRLETLFALSQIVLTARAHGLLALDGVHLHIQDTDGLAMACEQGRDLGFDGKTLIHPVQIDAANQAFAPSAADIDTATRRLQAWNDANGLVVVDGMLVENLHIEEAQRVLRMAECIRQRNG